jgi:hypothetical protein
MDADDLAFFDTDLIREKLDEVREAAFGGCVHVVIV